MASTIPSCSWSVSFWPWSNLYSGKSLISTSDCPFIMATRSIDRAGGIGTCGEIPLAASASLIFLAQDLSI